MWVVVGGVAATVAVAVCGRERRRKREAAVAAALAGGGVDDAAGEHSRDLPHAPLNGHGDAHHAGVDGVPAGMNGVAANGHSKGAGCDGVSNGCGAGTNGNADGNGNGGASHAGDLLQVGYVRTRLGALSRRVHREDREVVRRKVATLKTAVATASPLKFPRLRLRRPDTEHSMRLSDTDAARGPHVKLVHFLRHGEAASNSAARELGGHEYKSPAWFDARLTDLGKAQAKDVSGYILGSRLRVDVVLLSPLRRAAETACIAWSSLAAETNTPFVACEQLREKSHGNPCDARSTRGVLRDTFPCVDFSLLDEHDGLRGETWADVAHRAAGFLTWLAQRPEKHVAVVTHSAFLLTLFNAVFADQGVPEAKDWFETAELRTFVLEFADCDTD